MSNEDRDFRIIDTALIEEPSEVLRQNIDPVKLGELADNMSTQGLLQPIGVKKNADGKTYKISWGHRRFLAARSLLWRGITCRVLSSTDDPFLAAITENLQRVNLDPIEEGLAVKRLFDEGKSVAFISRFCRRSIKWCTDRLSLLTYHPDIIQAIQVGKMTLSVAEALQDIDHDKYREQLIDEALRTGATGPTAEIWRQHYIKDRDRIIRNEIVLDDVICQRDAWTIHVDCQACNTSTEYSNTKALRFCLSCSKQLMEELAAAQAEEKAAQQNNEG